MLTHIKHLAHKEPLAEFLPCLPGYPTLKGHLSYLFPRRLSQRVDLVWPRLGGKALQATTARRPSVSTQVRQVGKARGQSSGRREAGIAGDAGPLALGPHQARAAERACARRRSPPPPRARAQRP